MDADALAPLRLEASGVQGLRYQRFEVGELRWNNFISLWHLSAPNFLRHDKTWSAIDLEW